jgi:hypothetical protein
VNARAASWFTNWGRDEGKGGLVYYGIPGRSRGCLSLWRGREDTKIRIKIMIKIRTKSGIRIMTRTGSQNWATSFGSILITA